MVKKLFITNYTIILIGKAGFTWINARCRYIDIRTEAGLDICEYPDSDKINILDN
jgi:hypothetical protein